MPGSKPPVSALITCEHASARVPAYWQRLFCGQTEVLASHRAWDPGSLDLAEALARHLDAPLLAGQVTRLLIDLNRSSGHPRRFSEWTRGLPESDRVRIERSWWLPHWQVFGQFIRSNPGQVVHIGCHSFTPVLAGRRRRFDIGLLYDSRRWAERRLCRDLAGRLSARLTGIRVRMNQPYRGTANGIGQQHRRLYGPDRLLSVEVEINQRLVRRGDWGVVLAAISTELAELIRAWSPRVHEAADDPVSVISRASA